MTPFAPVTVALAVLLIGGLAYWLAAKTVGVASARVAAFSITLGILIGNSAGVERTSSEWMLNAVGAVLGLVALWWLLFKRGFQHG